MSRAVRAGLVLAVLAAGALWAVTLPAAGRSSSPAPYGLHDAGGFYNVLPAGEAGVDNAAAFAQFQATGKIPPHFADQLPLYANLIYADPTLKPRDIPRFFKDATFGVKAQNVRSVEHPEAGLTIVRDQWDVPHIYGRTRAQTEFGAGYAAAQDRLFLIDVLRHVARAQLSSFVGGSPSNRAMDETQWEIAPYREADLQWQITHAKQDCQLEAPPVGFPASQCGPLARTLKSDLHNFVGGINAYIRQATTDPSLLPAEYAAIGKLPQPWKPTDVIAEASLIGGIFGKGGGSEVRSAMVLQALQHRFGRLEGRRAWSDFREANDPEAPTTILGRRFPYETAGAFSPRGLALPDPGSVTFPAPGKVTGGAGDRAGSSGSLANLGAELLPLLHDPMHASNWELVSASHTVDHHPYAVMGPQVGYYVPEILMEEDLHAPASKAGPALDARGAAFPGVNLYVELGHGEDYAWSATTATSDNVDTFAEVLCHDAYHYMYRGHCRAMQKLTQTNTWTPNADDHTPPGSETLTAYRTVHGIVYARGRVHGRPVAFVHARSSYFHEADSALGFSELNEPGYIRGPASFQRAAGKINFLFNWAYVDASHISYYMSGWMPQRARGTSPDFPVLGTGQYDWKGYDPATHTADWLPFAQHPHVTDQAYLASWNNKQAPGWAAADDQWGYGPIFRQQLIANRIRADIAHGHRINIAQLVQSMEEPATEDLRAVLLLPIIFRAVGHPHSRALAHALLELRRWRAAGGHRRRRSAGAKHDLFTPAIELMDAWWPRLLAAEFRPMLGTRSFQAIQKIIGFGATDFAEGWFGYVSKDLRRVFGMGHERGPYSQAYCGNLPHHHFSASRLRQRCRAALISSLAAALKVKPGQLYGQVCPKDPEPACADENRWTEVSAITIPPFPYQNRPTFQQVVELTRHVRR
ncbi:MAG TPA: penicillin acylase family protein [Solirubrobacteraceae bacterium]|nr:penicillin acylase family protein [Solirubrobacteraceae bacterium]